MMSIKMLVIMAAVMSGAAAQAVVWLCPLVWIVAYPKLVLSSALQLSFFVFNVIGNLS